MENKENLHNSTIDILKAVAILLVLITHYSWTGEQRQNPVFPFLIDMAVPVFLIISGYVGALSFSKRQINSVSEAFTKKQILRKFIRYTIPFLILVIWEIIDPYIALPQGDKLDKVRWFLCGAQGPGSYYYPLLIQMIFVLPLIYFIIKRKGEIGLVICLCMNLAYEILQWAYSFSYDSYRLLIFRYIFVISAGVFAYEFSLRIRWAVIISLVGFSFIALTRYGIYSPRIISMWSGTSLFAVMWIIPITIFLIKNVHISFPPLEYIGRASYNIFLVQMIYYSSSFREKMFGDSASWEVVLIIGILICIVLGLVFYFIENKITSYILKRFL